MSYVFSPFGQTYYPGQPCSTSAFGTSSTTTPTSVLFGTPSAASVLGGPQVTNVGTAYATTDEVGKYAGKLQSISAMPIYSGKSHEEIRLESSNSREHASGLFGAPSVSGQNTNSTSNLSAFGSQVGGPRFDETSNNCFGTNSGSKSLFGDTASAGFGGSSALFGEPSFGSSFPNSGSNSFFGTTASTGFEPSLATFGVSSGTSFDSRFPSFGGNQTATRAFGTTFGPTNQTATHAFGTTFGPTNQRKGSRIEAYGATTAIEECNNKLHSLSAMGVYKDKSHEELRLEDYNASDRGQMSTFPLPSRDQSSTNASPLFYRFYNSQNPSTQTISNFSPPQSSNNPFLNSSFTSPRLCVEPTSLSLISSRVPSTNCPPTIFTSPFSPKAFAPQTPNNPFSPQAPNNPFAPQTPFTTCSPTYSFPFPSFPNGFPTKPLPPLRSSFLDQASFNFSPQVPSTTCPPTTSSFTFKPIAPETYPSIFSSQTSPSFIFPQVPSTTCPLTTSSSTLEPIAPETNSPLFAPQPTTNGDSVSEALPVVNNVRTCTHCSSLSNSAPELNSFPAPVDAQIPSLSTPWHSAQPVPTTNLQSSPEVIDRSTSSQGPASESTIDQPVVNASPFGELPELSRLTISEPGTTISIQYGISSMPVNDKPSAPIRLSSSLTSRHLSHTRMRLPARKYDSKSEGPKVPFFNKDEEIPCVRASSLIPRENPRAFVVLSAELWPHRSETEEISPDINVALHGNGEVVSSENITSSEPRNVLNIDLSVYESDIDEAKISKEHIDEIDAMMPQLSLPDYYTEPSIAQLAEKEKAEPGFCSRVTDFEIGRCDYGNIKFLGETDVRNLCLDSLVEFNTREVVVYKNENQKPPVGEGLNKQAEVTLLNIHCVDKKTGRKYVDGPIVEKYKELLIKKGGEQGVEFISFDPAKGEWKFKVQHF